MVAVVVVVVVVDECGSSFSPAAGIVLIIITV